MRANFLLQLLAALSRRLLGGGTPAASVPSNWMGQLRAALARSTPAYTAGAPKSLPGDRSITTLSANQVAESAVDGSYTEAARVSLLHDPDPTTEARAGRRLGADTRKSTVQRAGLTETELEPDDSVLRLELHLRERHRGRSMAGTFVLTLLVIGSTFVLALRGD